MDIKLNRYFLFDDVKSDIFQENINNFYEIMGIKETLKEMRK